MSAWAEIVCADITPEWLAMCNRALAEIQTEQRRKDAAKIRAHAATGDLNACEYGTNENVLEAADLIDPEVNPDV